MTLNLDITILTIIGVISALASIIGTWAVIRHTLGELKTEVSKLGTKHETLKDDFNKYQRDASDRYVTQAAFTAMENRLSSAISELKTEYREATSKILELLRK